MTDLTDVSEAVTLLETDPNVETWSISKITNGAHALAPLGAGYGVSAWTVDGSVQVFEKAGGEKTITEAARICIDRIAVRLATVRSAPSASTIKLAPKQ